MKTVLVSESDIEHIGHILLADGVVAFPTETVFGLGVLKHSKVGFAKLFDVKKRDLSKAITLMVCSIQTIQEIAVVDDKTLRFLKKVMPGQITVVLPLKQPLQMGSLLLKNIGIRIPDNDFVLGLLNEVGDMWVTSANISSQPNLFDFDKVFDVFKNQIDAVVTKNADGDVASTVVEIKNEQITILRNGRMSENQIKEAFR